MSEDSSDFMQKIGSMLNSDNIPDNLKEIVGSLNSSSRDATSGNSSSSISSESIANMINLLQNKSTNNKEESSSNNSTIDIETILKMKSIIDKMNSKDDPRANLLLSLKPYLNEIRKSKVEQYIQLFNMSKILDVFHSKGGGKENDV